MRFRIKNKRWFLLIGIIFFIWGLISFDKYKREFGDLIEREIRLKEDIENVTGRRNSADFRFNAKNYNARFKILDGAIRSENRKYIKNLKKGQVLKIKISMSDMDKLYQNSDINVYSIEVKNRLLLSTNDYNSNRKKYSNRKKAFLMFVGILAILKGLDVSTKTITIVFIGGIILFIIIKALNIGF